MTKIEKYLPWVCLFAFLILLGLDTGLWHPGFSYFDEGNGMLGHLQEWREGRALPFEIFKGSFHRAAAGLCTMIFKPQLWALRFPVVLAFGLENILLYLLGKRWISQRAGLWAVLANLVSALSFLRCRSLLVYSVLPFELLALMALLPRKASAWLALLWGAAVGAGLFDYEGWLFVLPVLTLAWFQEPRPRWRSFWASLAGFAVMLAYVLWRSKDSLASHILVRSRSVAGAGAGTLHLAWQSLVSFFVGTDTYGYMGVSGHSVFPSWALPALLLGAWMLWKEPKTRWLLAWIFLGCLPMAVVGTASEPNRLMVAWPALCLCAGAGFAQWPRFIKPGLAAALLGLALLGLGAVWEAKAYTDSMQIQYPRYYLESAQQMAAAKQMAKEQSQGILLISELDYEGAWPWRFVWQGYGPKKLDGGKAVALVPWEYAVKQDPSWGRWRNDLAGSEERPLEILEPSPTMLLRLEKIQQELLAARKGLPNYDYPSRREGLLAFLRTHPQADPWTRTALIENALGLSFLLGQVPDELLQCMLKEKLASASSYAWLADKLQQTQPAFAKYLCERALHKDPRRTDLNALLAKLSRAP